MPGLSSSLSLGLSRFRGGAAFTPAALFASGEAGAWYDPSDLSSMNTLSDQTGSTPGVGDPVGYLADKSGNGNHATQATSASRPVLRQTAGGLYYLEFDGVDDFVESAFTGPASNNDISVAYDPQSVDFVMAWISGTIYFGIGQSGSTSMTLAGGVNAPRDEYWGNTLSSNTTRGQNYTSAQGANIWLGRSAGWGSSSTFKIGALSGSFPGPKRVYQALYINRHLTSDERDKWTTYALGKVGV